MTLRPLLTFTAAALCGTAFAQADQEWSQRIVRQAEQALAQMNYSHGQIDGRMDPSTHYGLREFQRSRNLAVTGGLNMETLAALGIEQRQYGPQARRSISERADRPTGAREFSPVLVQRAEQALAQKQYVTGPIDGVLDAQTRYGLHNFQRAMDLATTGELNMETLEALGVEGRGGQVSAGGNAQASAGASGWAGGAGETLYTPQNIRAVEQSLKDKNYVVGPVNTEIEPDTQYGLRQFQRDQGLAATGNFNFETLEALGIDFNR